MKLLSDLNVAGKRVFLRADLDVKPTNDDGLTTNVRLQNIKPTVDYVLEHGAVRVVIVGHMGRPKKLFATAGNKPPFFNPDLSTEQLVVSLEKILDQKVVFCPNFGHLTEDKVILFENIRFWPGETINDRVFANKLCFLGDVYVNDAFGNCHREHASMVGVPAILPHAAGIHLQQEVEELSRILQDPVRPFVAIVGGVKKETKIPVIENLAKFADKVLVGGWLAYELATATDYSLPKTEKIVVAALNAENKDIDQNSINKFVEIIKGAKTVVWNGPVGEFETGNAAGTIAVAEAIVASGAYSVVGGGETSQFLTQHKIAANFSFVSSGGGAMLEFLAGRSLPGIKSLE